MTGATGLQRSSTDRSIATAYSATGSRWRDGPVVVYDRLADELVARTPVPIDRAAVVDIGAGTGAASFAAMRAGARCVIAVDIAAGMLAVDADRRPPAIAAEAARLPFAPASFDIALAAFSFNHLIDPEAGFVEAARIVRPGGAIVASAYAADDQHPVKGAVERSLRRRGWAPEPWYAEMQRDRAPLLSTEESCVAVMSAARLEASIEHVHVAFPDLGASNLVAWRMGMAQHAPFVSTLTSIERELAVRDALEELGDACPPLVRAVMIVTVRC